MNGKVLHFKRKKGGDDKQLTQDQQTMLEYLEALKDDIIEGRCSDALVTWMRVEREDESFPEDVEAFEYCTTCSSRVALISMMENFKCMLISNHCILDFFPEEEEMP